MKHASTDLKQQSTEFLASSMTNKEYTLTDLQKLDSETIELARLVDVSIVRKYVALAHTKAFCNEHCLVLTRANTDYSQWLVDGVSAQARRQQAPCLHGRDRIIEAIGQLY